MMPVKKGDKVKVDYEGKLDDGTVFDDSKQHGKPLEFEVGGGQVIPGFETSVIGMDKDEEKEIKIEPKDAYGDYNPEMIKEVPKDQLPKDQELKAGMMLAATMPNGAQIPAKITEVKDDAVMIDLNHPLAGKVLNFKIKVIEISS